MQKEIHDLKVQLTSTAEKEQDYLNQLLTLKTDLEQEAYDHFENIVFKFFWCYIEVTLIHSEMNYDYFLMKVLNHTV